MNDCKLNASKLDGYLNGIGIVCGDMGKYSSGAILLEAGCGKDDIKEAIIEYFPPEAGFDKFTFQEVKNNLGGLEINIQSYLLKNLLGDRNTHKKDILDARRKYISFQIMDMIDLIIGDCYKPTVYKIDANFKKSYSICTFFSITFESQTLVLQFLEPKEIRES